MSQGWGHLGSGGNGQAGGEPAGTAPGFKGPGFAWEHLEMLGAQSPAPPVAPAPAQPQPQPPPPAAMRKPSWPLPGTVHPGSITTRDAFPTTPSASQSFSAATGSPSLPSSSPPAPSYFRVTKPSGKYPSQQLQLPQAGISEFPGLHWKTPSPLPTPPPFTSSSPSA